MTYSAKLALSVLIIGGLVAAKVYLALKPATLGVLAVGGLLFMVSTPARAE